MVYTYMSSLRPNSLQMSRRPSRINKVFARSLCESRLLHITKQTQDKVSRRQEIVKLRESLQILFLTRRGRCGKTLDHWLEGSSPP